MSQALDKVPEPQRTISPEILALQDSSLQLLETFSGRTNVPEGSGRVSQVLEKVLEPLETMSPEILALQESILQLQETVSVRTNFPEE